MRNDIIRQGWKNYCDKRLSLIQKKIDIIYINIFYILKFDFLKRNLLNENLF